MSELTLLSLENSKKTIGNGFVDDLKQKISGDVITAASNGYDDARAIWNGMIDRRPGIIIRCKTSDDVVLAVQAAAKAGVPAAIRGGGHSIAGNSVVDDALVIDLSLMRNVTVDADKQVVTAEGGCLLGDVDKATQQHGLVVPGGIVSSTGLGGLTLGGGFGWTCRKYGMTIDNLLSAEIITADGRKVTASESENAELFWAIRGGGGNFGVVTRFTFKAHKIGPEVYGGIVAYPFDKAREFYRFYRDFTKKMPQELSVYVDIRHAPPLPFLPESVHGNLIVVPLFLYLGGEAEGSKAVAPLREFDKPLGEHVGPVPFADWQAGLDPLNEPGAFNYWKSHNLDDVSDGFIDTVLEYASRFPDPQTDILVAHLGGAVNNQSNGSSAYGHRESPYLMNVHTRWTDSAKTDACLKWVRGLFDDTREFSTGSVYVNFISEAEEERLNAAYPRAVRERLSKIKQQYDPRNMFRFNQNITPAGN